MRTDQHDISPVVEPAPRLIARFTRLARFGVVSGLGLCIDFAVSIMLREAGLAPGYANFCGATLAVTFVFFASVKRVFDADPASKGSKYAKYMIYQALAVPFASMLIHAITPAASRVLAGIVPHAGLAASVLARPSAAFTLAKCVVTPLTFYVNFLFMGWLLTGRVRWM